MHYAKFLADFCKRAGISEMMKDVINIKRPLKRKFLCPMSTFADMISRTKYHFVVIEGEGQRVHGRSHSKLPFWVISSRGAKF
jgi:hypothetical protein